MQSRVIYKVIETELEKVTLSDMHGVYRLGSIGYMATLLTTGHPRCMRLALHLGGNVYSTTSIKSPVQE